MGKRKATGLQKFRYVAFGEHEDHYSVRHPLARTSTTIPEHVATADQFLEPQRTESMPEMGMDDIGFNTNSESTEIIPLVKVHGYIILVGIMNAFHHFIKIGVHGKVAKCDCKSYSIECQKQIKEVEKGHYSDIEERSGNVVVDFVHSGNIYKAVHRHDRDPILKWGLLQRLNRVWKCLSCKRNQFNCEHMILSGLIQHGEQANKETIHSDNSSAQSFLDDSFGCKNYELIDEVVPKIVEDRLNGKIEAPSFTLDHCTSCVSQSITRKFNTCTVFLNNTFLKTEVPVGVCDACGCTLNCSGHRYGLLNMKNKIFFCYSLFFEFEKAILLSKITFTGFFSTKWELYQLAGNNMDDVGFRPETIVKRFTDGFFAFIRLKNINYIDSLTCCSAPVIVIDGISLGYNRDYFTLQKPDVEPIVHPAVDDIVGRSKFTDRILITVKKTRKLLKEYCKIGCTIQEKNQLLASFNTDEKLDCLVPMVRRSVFFGGRVRAQEQFRSTLLLFSTSSPICQTLPYSLVYVAKALVERKSLDFSLIEEHLVWKISPEFHKIVTVLRSLDLDCGMKLIGIMIEKSLSTYKIDKTGVQPIDNFQEDTLESFLKTGSFFSKYHSIKKRCRHYEIDNWSIDSSSRSESCRQTIHEDCCKNSYHTFDKTDGVFLVWCHRHSKCIGLFVLNGAEGCSQVFRALFTRYKDAQLKKIVYDNGCNLHNFFLNREAAFCRNIRFFVDQFHAIQHTCAASYSSANDNSILNSSLVEQKNRRVNNIRFSASWMGEKRFLLFTLHYIHLLNNKYSQNVDIV